MDSQSKAYEMFSDWYEFCLENGVEPEAVVAEFGEMMLITDKDLIDKIKEMS